MESSVNSLVVSSTPSSAIAPIHAHFNPAGYLLKVIGAGDPIYKGKDWSELWASSPEQRKRTEEYSTPSFFEKFDGHWQDPIYTIGRFTLHVFTGPLDNPPPTAPETK